MPDNAFKTVVATGALMLALPAPSMAQIAKFHGPAPAPKVQMIERLFSSQATPTNGSENDFVSNTSSMNEIQAASLDDMRDAESIVADEYSDDYAWQGNDDLGVSNDKANANQSQGATEKRNDQNDVDDGWGEELAGTAIASVRPRPQKVVSRAKSQSPRSAAKVNLQGYWSTGEFR